MERRIENISIKCENMFKLFGFSFIFVMIAAVKAQGIPPQRKLNVLVLYESLCPDSVRFMRDQLGPSYNELKDYININLVPFGKSYSENNGAEFYCQHGPAECEGNRIQSCIYAQLPDQHEKVQFGVCQMKSPKPHCEQCCSQFANIQNAILQCIKTVEGTQLQLEAEQITQKYSPSFIPTIIYDNVFDKQLQDNSIHNFRGTVCNLLHKRGLISFHTDICQ